jgi:hypothetical protein
MVVPKVDLPALFASGSETKQVSACAFGEGEERGRKVIQAVFVALIDLALRVVETEQLLIQAGIGFGWSRQYEGARRQDGAVVEKKERAKIVRQSCANPDDVVP